MTAADGTAAPPAETESDDRPFNWGRALDVAGVLAGIALAVIVADILTDGKLISRRLQRRPREEETSDPD